MQRHTQEPREVGAQTYQSQNAAEPSLSLSRGHMLTGADKSKQRVGEWDSCNSCSVGESTLKHRHGFEVDTGDLFVSSEKLLPTPPLRNINYINNISILKL